MGCSNTKLHAQQIAYQRDFLGACWNSTLGEEEAEEYLASRWMGVSKKVMALYTSNHCFTVRTLNKEEKARTDAAATGKPALTASKDPTGVKPGLGFGLGGAGNSTQTPTTSMNVSEPLSHSPTGKPSKSLGSHTTSYALFPDSRDGKELAVPSARPATPPPTTGRSTMPTTTAQRTTVRQSANHAHTVNNNSVTSAVDEHDGATNAATFASAARMAGAEKKKKGDDPAALRNVVKDSLESERVLHVDHPYLQRHGLSVYGGVVFRCAPAHRLYHRISLVPEASMKRLYDMQMTAMSRSVMLDASASMQGPPSGASGFGRESTYHHFQPDGGGGSSSDNPRLLPSHDGERRRVPVMTPSLPLSNPPSMVPSPMSRPISLPPSVAVAAAAGEARGSASRPRLPSMPLGAVAARHLRFTSAPEVQQSAVIDTWAAANPLSTFNNYPVEDRDVAGVTATRPPVIIGSVTAMELQALPPNAELCFGGWMYVSLQDEQERLRKSLKRYAARQRRRTAKAAAEDPTRFSGASLSAHRGKPAVRRATTDPRALSGADETDVDVGIEGSLANAHDLSHRTNSLTLSAFNLGDAPRSSASGVSKDADGGEERVPADGLKEAASQTISFKDSLRSPLWRGVSKEEEEAAAAAGDGGEVLHRTKDSCSAEGSPDGTLDHAVTAVAKSQSADVEAEAAKCSENNGVEKAATAPSTEVHERNAENKSGAPASASRARSKSSPPPPQTPSQMRQRAASLPPSPMIGATKLPAAAATAAPPLRHTGRYAREAMEADALHATWLPYAYIVVAVPMYECSLLPTTFHTAFTRHKAVSLNIGNAQSRQAYGVGCITGVRYGGVMIIEYRDKIDEQEDAEWIAELIRVGKLAQQGDSNVDDEDNPISGGNVDLSASALFRHIHHSAAHRARAEKLRRVKSRIWHKLRRQGLHVVLAATRMADRRHRQQRASVASEVSNLFNSNYADAAAATMGASHTPQHFAAGIRKSTSGVPRAETSVTGNAHHRSLSASRSGDGHPVRDENLGVDEGGIGADYGNGGGAEELNEAMEDANEDFDSTASSHTSDSDSVALDRVSRSSSARGDGAGTGDYERGTAGSVRGDRASRKRNGQWWRSSSSRHRQRRRRDTAGGERERATMGDGPGHQRHHHHRHGATTREDRLQWADPQMSDDFYLRGTFRQIGGMKYLDVVSLMDGCPLSELVQGIKRWVLNLLSMPIKARPVCLFLQRYEGIAASLRVMQTQLTVTALAANVASGKQLAQTNLSFNISPSGMPGAEGSLGMDEVAASFATQYPLDPTLEVASPSALVNASFAALQAPIPPPTRTLVYHTYYCGPLEPEVRAVMSPEIEAMISSCQTLQLPEVLESPDAQAADADCSANKANQLSPPLRNAQSGQHATAANTNATPTPATKAASPPVASPLSDAVASTLSPNLAPSKPSFGMPNCVQVNPLSTLKQQQPPTQSQRIHGSFAGSGALPLAPAAHHESAAAQPQPQTVSLSPHGSFAAPSAAARTTEALQADAAEHTKPPANTIPTTITECLLYDDPTKAETAIGNSFTASSGHALAAAAAAMMLADNVKGPAAVANTSFTAASVNTSSFPTIHGLAEESMTAGLHSVNAGSFGHAKGSKDHTLANHEHGDHNNNNNNTSIVSLGDVLLKARKQTRDAATEELPKAKLPDAAASKDENRRGASLDTSTGTYSRREVPEDAAYRTPAVPLLLPAASACNRSELAREDKDGSDNSDPSFNDDGAEERELEWQLADRELRALRSDLDEMVYLTTTARGELLERLKELIQLGALFLPHTRPDQVGLCLITMKMLRQYPEEVPVKEIHTDWVPLLMTLLTTSRENLFCTSGYEDGDFGRMIHGAQEFLATYNNIVDASDMNDAAKLRQACEAGVTKYMINPLPPMPAPRRLHDIVIAPQPVRFTKTLLQDMQRVGLDSEGLSFSFSGGSLGVLAGVLHYYSDFLRQKYRAEVAAVGGRAKDAGATVLDVLTRGGYNVLLRRIWIWGVTPEAKHSARYNASTAAKKILPKSWARGEDANSNGSSNSVPLPLDEREYVTMNTAGVGGGFVRVVGKPFRGTEAYALYDAIAHYLRTLEELCTEHNGNNSMAPQAPVKRRSVLTAWRRGKDAEPSSGDGQKSGIEGVTDMVLGARDLVPHFEVCVATNYYYKRMLDEAHWPARRRTGEPSLPHRASTANVRSGVEGVAQVPSPAGQRREGNALLAEKAAMSSAVAQLFASSRKHEGSPIGDGDFGSGTSAHDRGSVLEQPYCGGEETAKKDAVQRKATKKFYGFLADHYEQWRARHGDDKMTSAFGKRITVSLS